MQQFVAKHAEHVIGTLSGFDRLVFRGTMRALCSRSGLMSYLWAVQVRLTDFAAHALKLTEQLKDASLSLARQSGRPVQVPDLGRQQQRAHRPADRRGRPHQARADLRADSGRAVLVV